MFNNRKLINDLKIKIEFLEKDLESKENSVISVLDANKELSLSNNYLEKQNILLKRTNIKIVDEVEEIVKERDSYKELYKKEYENFNRAHELARKNRNKVSVLEEVIKKHEENECRLNTELCKYKGKLDKVKNAYRTLTGEELE